MLVGGGTGLVPLLRLAIHLNSTENRYNLNYRGKNPFRSILRKAGRKMFRGHESSSCRYYRGWKLWDKRTDY